MIFVWDLCVISFNSLLHVVCTYSGLYIALNETFKLTKIDKICFLWESLYICCALKPFVSDFCKVDMWFGWCEPKYIFLLLYQTLALFFPKSTIFHNQTLIPLYAASPSGFTSDIWSARFLLSSSFYHFSFVLSMSVFWQGSGGKDVFKEKNDCRQKFHPCNRSSIGRFRFRDST